MKQLFRTICFVLCCSNSQATPAPAALYWDKGNKAYQQKQYDSALFYYAQLIVNDPTNSIVYYNMGNAFYRNNQVSQAVLHYERALFYNPQLAKAKDNLKLAQGRIQNAIRPRNDIFFLRWWTSMTAGNTAGIWGSISLALFLVLLILITLRLVKNTRSIPGQVFIIVPLFILLLLFCAFTATRRSLSSNRAVVMGNTAIMTVAPDVYKGQLALPEATTVETGEHKGRWVSITLPDKRTGWIHQSELAPVHAGTQKN